jgi:hypothetical protein
MFCSKPIPLLYYGCYGPLLLFLRTIDDLSGVFTIEFPRLYGRASIEDEVRIIILCISFCVLVISMTLEEDRCKLSIDGSLLSLRSSN